MSKDDMDLHLQFRVEARKRSGDTHRDEVTAMLHDRAEADKLIKFLEKMGFYISLVKIDSVVERQDDIPHELEDPNNN